jgi:ABC-type antimicrobial peptide transport system permease subunit
MVMESPYSEVRPVIYYSSNEPGNLVIIKINPNASAKEALSRIEPIFKKFNPGQPFEYQFTDSEYAKKFGDEERIGKLASFFAILAIIISCLGLFGLTSFVAEQRKKEIGVRKVLGASVFSVWNLLSKDFIGLVTIAFVIAVPLAWYGMHKWLQDYSYRINIGWGIFLLAGIIAIAIALLTVSFQAIRAAVANPARSLRTE